jgi:hypothetical protein
MEEDNMEEIEEVITEDIGVHTTKEKEVIEGIIIGVTMREVEDIAVEEEVDMEEDMTEMTPNDRDTMRMMTLKPD